MNLSSGSEMRVEIDRLRPGVFIRLEGLAWYSHPFFSSSFRIKNVEQIEVLRSLGLKKVIYVPDKSLVEPLNDLPKSKVKSSVRLPSDNSVSTQLYEEKKQRIEALRDKKESVVRAEKKYSLSLSQIENLMLSINRGNPQFTDEAIDLSNDLASHFLEDSESIMHVLNVQDDKNSSLYYHSLNVTMLSLILGRAVGLEEKSLSNLALGAMFHDIGKSKIEKKILLKKGKLAQKERTLIQKHPFYGVQILSKSEQFPVESMDIVYQHHERCDGRGYPRQLKSNEISRLTKILTVADCYDGLINRHDPQKSLTPYQALSYMFTKYSAVLDKESLSVFIRCMGVYPPGTIVVLNGDQIGMVVSVNLANVLAPSIVLYDPQIPKKEALIIDLDSEIDFKISSSIHPGKLPKEIFDYLSPRSRITYFVESEFIKD